MSDTRIRASTNAVEPSQALASTPSTSPALPGTAEFRPLVIGSPRSGFALLCSISSSLLPLAPPRIDLRQRLLNAAIDLFGDHIPNMIVRAFAEAGVTGDLIYNANFRKLTGGPKWLNPDRPDEAHFRKYVGVRGLGDFSLVTSHPRAVLHHDDVVHSHTGPALWAAHPAYRDYCKLASVRNPVGIVNSSLFSINALTSEYIQRFLPPEQDNDEMRQELALYKFTDLDFFEGIVRFYARYFKEFLSVRDRYLVMRWEDLITSPAATIAGLARGAGIPITEANAAQIWQRLDHVNLTGAHKHNYRRGKGKVGDWKNWMTNRHLEIMRAHGFDPILQALGYGPIEMLDESAYTPFQRRVRAMLKRGEIYRNFQDTDLFGFAFNKSNLDSEKFPFRRYDWKTATRVERSSFQAEDMLERVWQAADRSVVRLNRVFEAVLAGDYATETGAQRAIGEARKAAVDLVAFMPKAHGALAPTLESIVRRALTTSAADDADQRPPQLIFGFRRHNIVGYQRRFHVVPQAAGAIDLARQAGDTIAGGVTTASFAAARAAAEWLEREPPPSGGAHDALETVAGHDVIRAGDLIWAAPAGAVPADFSPGTLAARPGFIAGVSLDEVKDLLRRRAVAQTPGQTSIAPEGGRGDASALRLEFVEDDTSALAAAAEALSAAGRRVCLRPWGDRAREIATRLLERFPEVTVFASGPGDPDVAGVTLVEPLDSRVTATVLLHGDADTLAAALTEYINLSAGRIVAPITARHSSKLPLFLISIPKAGTHLLFGLARALGYLDGGAYLDVVQGGHWYYLEYSNSHTTAPDFFIDTVRRQPFGNRSHPFRRTPALFIYRHPFDILVSEANYYHREGNSPFGPYLAALTFEQRIERLIDDRWLLGTLRDRVGRFAAWLEFPNAVPVSFEEIVGSSGGGSDALQRAAIWSLLLKLQVAGDPDAIARTVFSPESPTFHSGRIGEHRKRLTPAAREQLRKLPPDYVEVFGYDAADDGQTRSYPSRIEEFRKRPLVLGGSRFDETPILLEGDWLGYSIVGYRDRFFAMPHDGGEVDLAAMSEDALAVLTQDADRASLKRQLLIRIASDAVVKQVVRSDETATALARAAARVSSAKARRIGTWLGYDLWRVDQHTAAAPRSAAPSDAAAATLWAHSRSAVMLRILLDRLVKMFARRPGAGAGS